MDSPFLSSSPLSTPTPSRPPRPAVTLTSFVQLWPVLPAAVLVGAVYHFIGRYIDLLVLFPLLAGACVGGVLASQAKKHKVRSKIVLCTLAIVGGLLCFGTRWVGDSLQAREEVINTYAARLGGGNAASEAKAQSLLRQQLTPTKFFPMYLRAAAREGATISSTHGSSSSSGAPIKGTGFWLLALGDALLMCGAAIGLAWKQASDPFCLPCDSWYGVELTVSRLHPSQAGEATQLAQSGNWTGLGGLRSSGATEKSHCDVLLSKCPGCSTGRLSIKRRLNNQVKTLWQGMVSANDTRVLEEVRAQWLQ